MMLGILKMTEIGQIENTIVCKKMKENTHSKLRNISV